MTAVTTETQTASPATNVVAFPRSRARAPSLGRLAAALDVRDLAGVSRQLVVAYALLSELGHPPQAIAEVMLEATVGFHDAYDLGGDLPDRLRGLASAIEAQARVPVGVA